MNSQKLSQLDVVKKLKRAEKRLRSLTRELQSLEARKQGYLQDMVRGGKLLREVKEAEQAITRKHRAISRAKEAVSNLHAQLEGELARLKRDLILQKQRELDRHMGQRERYLKGIEELEVEISRYRYLVTGKKDRRLAAVEDPLPQEVMDRDTFISIDEVIGHIRLEICRIIRMNSEALLKEYVRRESENHQGFTKDCESPS